MPIGLTRNEIHHIHHKHHIHHIRWHYKDNTEHATLHAKGRVHKHVKSHRGNEPRLPLRPPSAMRPDEHHGNEHGKE